MNNEEFGRGKQPANGSNGRTDWSSVIQSVSSSIHEGGGRYKGSDGEVGAGRERGWGTGREGGRGW